MAASPFARDVVAGLSARPKRLSPKYFYDAIGSELFERITDQVEYYPTRTEAAILTDHASDFATLIPAGAALVEFGSGSSAKTRIVLRAAKDLGAYVPVDISGEFLDAEAVRLRADFPQLTVLPVVADFVETFGLPPEVAGKPLVGFFPGSTIGNFEPHEACTFLRNAGDILGAGAKLIVGVDLEKDSAILNAAYNDKAGVTADFNLNLLARINRELGGNFDLACFDHHAFYNRERHRIEMHLASIKRQKVKVCGETFDFRVGETIHTESSYKYSIDSFVALARGSGWTSRAVWTDAEQKFSVHVLARDGA